MDVKSAIEKRRSIRKYKDKEVPDSLIKEIIGAARLAPSAYNAQPSRFVIIKSRETKETLKKNNVFKQAFVYNSPLIIVCLGDPEAYPKERLEPIYSNSQEIAGDVGAVRDVSISTQNLVLRAVDLGLGTCYIGLVARNKIKKILDIPNNYVLPFVITAGYPAEKPKPMPRKNLKDLIIKNI
jgi:nitroreductase